MSEASATFTYGAEIWIVLGLYFLVLLGLAYWSWRRLQEAIRDSTATGLRHYYLAGGTMGRLVTTCSTIASLFSGYTIVGIPAEAVRDGFNALRWVGGTLSIAWAFILFAPRLNFLAHRRKYLSTIDFLKDRYGREGQMASLLIILILVATIVPTFVYIVGQFGAFSASIVRMSNFVIPSWLAAVCLAVLLVGFESLGGLTIVALTDVIQGIILGFGAFAMYAYVATVFKGMGYIKTQLPEDMTATIPTSGCLGWLNFSLLCAAFPLYPHLMTRIMAARDARTFRFALTVMSLCPLVLSVASVMAGLAVKSLGLPDLEANSAFTVFAGKIMESGVLGLVLGALIVCASVAAIMSSTDSLLIALSQIVTLEALLPLYPKLRPERILWLGKGVSVGVAVLSVVVAEANVNLAALVLIQGAMLAQCGPAYICGMYWRGVRCMSLVLGMVAGLGLVLARRGETFWGVHNGVGALLLNVALVVAGSHLQNWLDAFPQREGMPREASAADTEMSHKALDRPDTDPGLARSLQPGTAADPPPKASPDADAQNADPTLDLAAKSPRALPEGTDIACDMESQDAGPDLPGPETEPIVAGLTRHCSRPNMQMVRERSQHPAPDTFLPWEYVGLDITAAGASREPISMPVVVLSPLIVLILSIPWYRKAGVQDPFVLGFPVWAFCWLLGCLLAALLYIGIMFRCWTPAPEAEGPGNGASGAAQGPEGQAQ